MTPPADIHWGRGSGQGSEGERAFARVSESEGVRERVRASVYASMPG